MIGDVKTDLTEGEHAEEMAQKDYENLMAASQKSRATNAESITEKESASAEWSEKIEIAKTDSASTTQALATLKEYIAGLHSSCDFLVEEYETRKEARTNEIEGNVSHCQKPSAPTCAYRRYMANVGKLYLLTY